MGLSSSGAAWEAEYLSSHLRDTISTAVKYRVGPEIVIVLST
jgi:hypothetical protein